MTDRFAATELGKHHNFFASMKCSSREQYDYISNLHGSNMIENFTIYIEEQFTIRDALATYYFWLEDYQLIFEFSQLLFELKITGNIRTFSTGGKSVIFNGDNEFNSHKNYIQYCKILKLLIKYKIKKGLQHDRTRPTSINKQELELL